MPHDGHLPISMYSAGEPGCPCIVSRACRSECVSPASVKPLVRNIRSTSSRHVCARHARPDDHAAREHRLNGPRVHGLPELPGVDQAAIVGREELIQVHEGAADLEEAHRDRGIGLAGGDFQVRPVEGEGELR